MEEYSFKPFEKEEDKVPDFIKEEAYLRAKKKVESLVGFYWHLASYIVVNAFLIILIGINTSFTSFGPYATAVFWGIGLLFHFIGVFGQDVFFGKDWEKRKIKEFMDKDREGWE